jgi:glycosyltransferase involved in cell wall biosynthesis
MKLTLCMIVKNEVHCIERALRSALPLIDKAVIIDTGSTDDTQMMVANVLYGAGISYLPRSEPWVDFSTNRNSALKHCYGPTLLLDADEEIIEAKPIGNNWYSMQSAWHTKGEVRYLRPAVIDPFAWEYVGRVHETLKPVDEKRDHYNQVLDKWLIKDHFDSARNRQGNKFRQDIELLLQDSPTPRTLFYLAQTYLWNHQVEEALYYFRLRVSEEGWEEEVWFSLYMIARCMRQLHWPQEKVVTGYLLAHEYRKTRAEPLVELAGYLASQNRRSEAASILTKASTIPFPSRDCLNIDSRCYAMLKSSTSHRQP